jgi:hypothetical protein
MLWLCLVAVVLVAQVVLLKVDFIAVAVAQAECL